MISPKLFENDYDLRVAQYSAKKMQKSKNEEHDYQKTESFTITQITLNRKRGAGERPFYIFVAPPPTLPPQSTRRMPGYLSLLVSQTS